MTDTTHPERGVTDVLDAIRNDEAFKERFLAKYPEQAPNVSQWLDDPACRCRGHITNVVLQWGDEADTIAMELFGEPVTMVLPRSLAGEFIDIPSDPKAWNAMVRRAERFGLAYRGIATIPGKNDQGAPMIRCLFY